MIPLVLASICTALSGCTEPTEAARFPSVPPGRLVSAPIRCATLQFTIVNATTAKVAFPASNCGTGLRVINGGTVTWSGTTRLLTMNIRILNTSGQTVENPVRAELPDTGRFVTDPSAQPGSRITATNPDSLYSNATAVWFLGTTVFLPTGHSTAVRQMKLTIATPVITGEVRFTVTANEVIVGMPPLAPNLQPAWFKDDSSLTTGGAAAVKRALAVDFVAGATVAQKQAAIDSVQGSVIGGGPWINAPSQGVYFIRVPFGHTLAGLDSAIAILERQAVVERASLILRVVPLGPRSNDGAGWKRSDWGRSTADACPSAGRGCLGSVRGLRDHLFHFVQIATTAQPFQ